MRHLAFFSLGLIGLTGCLPLKVQPDQATLNSVSVINTRKDNIKVKINNGTATFYYLDNTDNTMLKPYNILYTGKVSAKPRQGTQLYDLFYKDEHIGVADKDTPKICDTYQIAGETFDFPCDAVFYHSPEGARSKQPPSMMLSLANIIDAKNGDRMPRATQQLALSQEDGRVDLSQWAQNQIDQYNTSTCLYNSTTGILEWFASRMSGQQENLAELDVLGRLETTAEEPEIHAWENANKLQYVVRENVVNTDQSYREKNDFSDVWNWARTQASQWAQGSRVDLNFRLQGTTLYWYGRNNIKRTTHEDTEKIAQWLLTKETPVHLFAMYGQIWHAIMVTGYDKSSDSFFVKDSLGNTNLKGKWYPRSFIADNSYGAVGISSSDGQSTQTASTPSTPETTPSGVLQPNPASRPPGNQSGSDNPDLRGSANNPAPTDANPNLCYIGRRQKQGSDVPVCSIWNIKDRDSTGKAWHSIAANRNPEQQCHIYAFMRDLGSRYGDLMAHCGGRYRMWTGRY